METVASPRTKYYYYLQDLSHVLLRARLQAQGTELSLHPVNPLGQRLAPSFPGSSSF